MIFMSFYIYFTCIFFSRKLIIIIYVYFLIRALELAVRHKRQIEEVLSKRAKYLQIINKNETNQSFLTLIGNISTLESANKVSKSIRLYVMRLRY